MRMIHLGSREDAVETVTALAECDSVNLYYYDIGPEVSINGFKNGTQTLLVHVEGKMIFDPLWKKAEGSDKDKLTYLLCSIIGDENEEEKV